LGAFKLDINEKIRKRYDRASSLYDILEQPMEIMTLKRWRTEVMKELQGDVLEVGVGTGKNIQYYPDNINVTAIDFSEKMLEKAREKADIYNKKVELIHMDAQNIEFPDNSFDCVFTTCVFCSVPDPVKGLKEIKRVCKGDGKIIMIEHERSENRAIGLLMDIFNPLTLNLYGANINRRTVDNIKKAGFTKIDVTNLKSDILKKIVIHNFKN